MVGLLNRVRSALSSVMRPVASGIASAGITPNQITVMGFAVSVASAYFFYSAMPLWGGLLILLTGFFDMLDGAVAKVSGKVTRFGGALDSTLDRYSDMVIIGAIILGGLCDPVWGILAMVGSFMVSYVRARGEVEGVKMAGVGLMERAERLIVLTLSALVGFTWFGIVLLAILANFTALQRLYHMKKELASTTQPTQQSS
jgi:archaetidylinositol phosphate synthase